MKQPGKYIIYLLFGLFTASALMPSCTDGNGPDDLKPTDRVSLSISFHSAQTRAENGVRGTEIDVESESKIYSLAVLVFKSGSDELDGSKFINRELKDTQDAQDREDYKELEEIKEIELTPGVRDIYIIANAPDGHFSGVTDRTSFKAKLEDLSAQKVYGFQEGESSGDTPIGGEDPVDRYTNLVMSQSFIGLTIEGGEKQYLGYTEEELPEGATPLNEGKPVELVRLVARVAIQKIAFELPAELTFDGIKTTDYNQYVDTVFMINAKTSSTYFPGETGFTGPDGSFVHGNIPGYNFLKGKLSNISGESTYADYLSKPVNFPEYDIENNQVPLWFYAFENSQSNTYPTGFVIGVKYQYKNTQDSELEVKKAYYVVTVNRAGAGSANHNFIKRNNQYGIKVTIKGLGSYVGDYPRSAGIGALRATGFLSSQDTDGVMEIEETVGPNLFPWTGDIYK
ncbi:Major fimbrial subunit protein (FimA) [Proteiniphilum saccharofermentans]|uniref:Major fimbrial subunit protein (FimA) n=1 Tax=Proteiniphilum saccharofermentans TaxID=1642647 RepID=A0A1R3SW76_9BACT|nr:MULTISPECIES: fimbrial protein [Proteiniphilum]SCD19801.1 Major fimbrial subunit protein (FimA) [Proteiniphilum saccharofermentans]SFK92354.1 Major fimbrial subunit protein (FimA) [Porphyromonadaceae bacterium KH3CP3RA]